MKILHIGYLFMVGGAETMLVDIINRQVASAEVALCIINDRLNYDLLEKLDSRVKKILIKRKEGSKNPFKFLQLNLEIARFHPDIIHSHQDIITQVLSPFFRKKILTVHDVDVQLKYLDRYQVICSISRSVQQDIESRYNVRSELVYNGIDLSQIRQSVSVSRKQGPFRILQVSRLVHEKKGQDILIRALSRLKEDLPEHSFLLDFIGCGPSEEYLKQLSLEYKMGDTVRFLGERDRSYIYESIADYHLLVQPSRYEGFGLTVLEGLAAKVPVLSSDNDGPEEILQSGKYGFLFQNGSVEDCVRKLKEIFMNYQALDPMLDEAFHYVSDCFDISCTAQSYLDVYKKVLKA